MSKRPIIVVSLIVLAAAAGAWWWHARPPAAAEPGAASAAGGGRRGGAGAGPVSVLVAPAAPGELAVTRNALGTVTSLAAVAVRAQIAGTLDRVLFGEGQLVKQGDVLAQIDARPFALAQAQYEGQVQRDQAQLDQAQQDLTRYQKLVEQDSLARQQLDTQAALVAQLRGTVATGTAQIETAKLNQTYCRVVAPIAGRLGLRLVDQGNYVTPGDANGLVTITQVAPVSVTFTVPQTDLPQVLPRLRAGEPLAVTVLDRDGTSRLARGAVATIDNAIDASTGTVKLRALFANDDERLFPNQFVNVRLELERHQAAVAVPAAAVLHGPQGAYVWLVNDGKAGQRAVTTGVATSERVEISAGLAAGDQVVVDGVDRLREGAPVVTAVAEGRGGNRPRRDGAGGEGGKHGGEGGKPAGEAGKPAGDGAARKHGGDGDGDGAKPAPAAGQ